MKTAYRIYLVLCMGVGIFCQYGNPHPDYLLGWFYGLVGSWLGPGILLEFLLGQSRNMTTIMGGSFVFWLIAGSLYKSRTKAPRPSRGVTVGPSASPAAWEGFSRSRTYHSQWEEE